MQLDPQLLRALTEKVYLEIRSAELAHSDTFEASTLEKLVELIYEHVGHTSWRCQYQKRYPWNPDCCCGLVSALSDLGLPTELAAVDDPEA